MRLSHHHDASCWEEPYRPIPPPRPASTESSHLRDRIRTVGAMPVVSPPVTPGAVGERATPRPAARRYFATSLAGMYPFASAPQPPPCTRRRPLSRERHQQHSDEQLSSSSSVRPRNDSGGGVAHHMADRRRDAPRPPSMSLSQMGSQRDCGTPRRCLLRMQDDGKAEMSFGALVSDFMLLLERHGDPPRGSTGVPIVTKGATSTTLDGGVTDAGWGRGSPLPLRGHYVANDDDQSDSTDTPLGSRAASSSEHAAGERDEQQVREDGEGDAERSWSKQRASTPGITRLRLCGGSRPPLWAPPGPSSCRRPGSALSSSGRCHTPSAMCTAAYAALKESLAGAADESSRVPRGGLHVQAQPPAKLNFLIHTIDDLVTSWRSASPSAAPLTGGDAGGAAGGCSFRSTTAGRWRRLPMPPDAPFRRSQRVEVFVDRGSAIGFVEYCGPRPTNRLPPSERTRTGPSGLTACGTTSAAALAYAPAAAQRLQASSAANRRVPSPTAGEWSDLAAIPRPPLSPASCGRRVTSGRGRDKVPSSAIHESHPTTGPRPPHPTSMTTTTAASPRRPLSDLPVRVVAPSSYVVAVDVIAWPSATRFVPGMPESSVPSFFSKPGSGCGRVLLVPCAFVRDAVESRR